MVPGTKKEVRNCALEGPFPRVLSGREARGGGQLNRAGEGPGRRGSSSVGQNEQTDPLLLPTLPFQRGRLAPQPCWMPYTELWLAVSSCVESPWHQPLQLQHSATPSSSPAEVASPVCGPPGQPGHHQTSLEEQPGHILGTLEVQAPSETGPSSEPSSHPFLGFLPDSLAAPAFLLPGSTLP